MGINYIEHETQVQYIDGILSHSQEWQWFIDTVQERFEINEVKSWGEYIKESPNIQMVYSYFIKILEVCDKDWSFTKEDFQEIWNIAKFFLGQDDVDNCKEKLRSNHSKLLFFCVWLVKLENSDNNTRYIYDVRLLNQKNYFQLIKCDSIIECKENLIDYAEEIPIRGIAVPIQRLHDNLNKIEYPCDIDFLKSNKEKILNYNAFCFQPVNTDDCSTWQEVFLLDMLKVAFHDKKVLPLISYESGEMIPDLSLWTEEMLCKLQNYFHHQTASFVIETINYVLYGNEPSKEIKLLHCKFLSEKLNIGESSQIFSSSSYQIISYLFNDKMFNDCLRENEYKNFLEKLREFEDPDYIMHLKEDGYPLSKIQKNILNNYLNHRFKEIDNVCTLRELLSYLKDDDIAKQIDVEYLQKLHKKLVGQAVGGSDILIASTFYEYMRFLFCARNSNTNIDKRYIHREMINIQKVWQGDVYERVFNSLQAVPYEQKVNIEELENVSQVALLNPIVFANICMPSSEKEIIKIMMTASEYPLQYEVSKVVIAPEFPYMKGEPILSRYEIDTLFLNYIEKLQKEYRHKFLNNLTPQKFLEAIYDRYELNTKSSMALFMKEEELYNVVKEETHLELLPYSNDISLAIVTQLFPVLEVEIRELVKLFDVFPYKDKGFMNADFPAGLLNILIKLVYDEQHSFENIPDLLFVYNVMYNVNSCNIRNECIHGRNYLYGNDLRFAFRATLFSIHMIVFRIKTIKVNVSDIHETT